MTTSARPAPPSSRTSTNRLRTARKPTRRSGRNNRSAAPMSSATPMTTSPRRQCSKVISSRPTPTTTSTASNGSCRISPARNGRRMYSGGRAVGEDGGRAAGRDGGWLMGASAEKGAALGGPLGGEDNVLQQHRPGHRADAAGVRRREAGDVDDVERHVAGDLAVDPAHADIEDGSPGL